MVERALNKDILIELFENRDSERDDRMGTLIRLALFDLPLALRFFNLGERDEIRT